MRTAQFEGERKYRSGYTHAVHKTLDLVQSRLFTIEELNAWGNAVTDWQELQLRGEDSPSEPPMPQKKT